MLNMHQFHAWLFQALNGSDAVREGLARVAQAKPDQLGALQSALEWGAWGARPG